jgi:formate C-acetyltransferase
MNYKLKQKNKFKIKTPKDLSRRIKFLRDYYFKGVNRAWNNEFTSWSTGTPWDFQYEEFTYYIVPESYAFHKTFASAFKQKSKKVKLPKNFWRLSIPERKAWFVKEVMLNYLPQEILPGDLIAGARFNIQTSTCLTKKEADEYKKMLNKARRSMKYLHDHGFGNAGATSGHIIPDYERIIKKGWVDVYEELKAKLLKKISSKSKAQIKAMMTAALTAKELAEKYSDLCMRLAEKENNKTRKKELEEMARNLKIVPWWPAENFWQAVQSLWITHMLVMAEENYPGPGTSFGRIDRYLFPLWEKSIQSGMTKDFGKEIMKCFWIHTNTAYDAQIRVGGNQGITAGFGQLLTLSGMGPDKKDMTNDLTYAILEVIDEMSPILEPKPNVRLHRNTPCKLLNKIIDMVSESQGAPFILNFDERSMAGLIYQAEKAGVSKYINEKNVFDYAPVGCLENTMVGNDRSGTVDINLNLLKAVELTLTNGYDMIPRIDPFTFKEEPIKKRSLQTGDPNKFKSWEEFWKAFSMQMAYIVKLTSDTYEKSEKLRAKFSPTPYLSCLVKGCADKGADVTQGGAELNFVTVEGVGFASMADSLLAVRYLVFDEKICTMNELLAALRNNWQGHEILQATAVNKAPKYGRDDDNADKIAQEALKLWVDNIWKYKTKSTNRIFRPGLLSWNYWITYGNISPASPDGRPKGRFLSNALCPVDGADINGPTANVNSAGKVIGGKNEQGKGFYEDYINLIPNGGSHTITFNPSILKTEEHKEKFKSFLKAYIENGGTALQINMINAEMLKDAQKNPKNYKNLLVRVTGYNAYFTSIGKELQDEIIAREIHRM